MRYLRYREVVVLRGAVAMAWIVAVGATGFAAGQPDSMTIVDRDLGNVSSVTVESGSVGVSITSSGDSVRLGGSMRDGWILHVSTAGDHATIRISGDVSRGSGGAGRGGRDRLELQVPPGRSVTVESGSGAVRVEGVAFRELTVRAGSGGVELADVTGVRRIETSSGSIDGRGLTLDGDVNLSTGSGDIDLVLTNDAGRVKFDLEAAEGNLRVNGTRTSHRLVMGSGRVTLHGRSESGDQRYRTR